MKLDNKLKMYAVTDRMWLKEGETLASVVEEVLKGGATFIQLREKNIDSESFEKLAIDIQKLCKKYDVPFVIDDNVELAVKIDADGVHVGQKDLEASKAREMIGKDKILGVSAGNLQEALAAVDAGADYLGVGAVFNTTTKLDAKNTSFDMLREITRSVNIPVVAIGGINEDNVVLLKGTGISGIAVISGIFAKDDKRKATETLVKKLGEIL